MDMNSLTDGLSGPPLPASGWSNLLRSDCGSASSSPVRSTRISLTSAVDRTPEKVATKRVYRNERSIKKLDWIGKSISQASVLKEKGEDDTTHSDSAFRSS